jgi:hypothetical protein
MIDEIEKAKALERKAVGGETAGRSRPKKVGIHGSQPIGERNPRVRDIVGSKVGMSGSQYDRAKYIADFGSSDMIDELDKGVRTVRSAYDELHGASSKPDPKATSTEVGKAHEKPIVYSTLALVEPSAPKVAKTQTESVRPTSAPTNDHDRAIRAEQELDSMKYGGTTKYTIATALLKATKCKPPEWKRPSPNWKRPSPKHMREFGNWKALSQRSVTYYNSL